MCPTHTKNALEVHWTGTNIAHGMQRILDCLCVELSSSAKPGGFPWKPSLAFRVHSNLRLSMLVGHCDACLALPGCACLAAFVCASNYRSHVHLPDQEYTRYTEMAFFRSVRTFRSFLQPSFHHFRASRKGNNFRNEMERREKD